MARSNKLDCEYTLEEAKNVDANDITTHPFFKKHFSGMQNRKGYFNSDMYVKPDAEQQHVIHYLTHIPLDPHHESNLDHATHSVKIETQHYGRTKHIGHGRGMTVHEALSNAIHTYTHPFKINRLTESLAGKKPATASKLFAEAMEARLDEISKKTLGRYIERAVVDRDRHIEDATQARASADALNNVRADGDAASQTKRSLRSFLGDQERTAHNKKYKRETGVLKALNRLTKEDLDEVEAPANFWNAGMARMNPIQVSQKQPAEPGQFKATLTKSPKRLADQDSSLEGKPRAVRDETETVAASRGPKTIELTGDWHADVPDHQFDPKLDSETEYYPLFSQFKSLGAYPSGPARAWESEEIDEDELNEISKKTLSKYVDVAADKLAGHAYLAGGGSGLDKEGKTKEFRKAVNRLKGIKLANKKLSEDSASLMATATKDEKKAAEQDKKKPVEFKKLHDKHEAEVKSKMKELGEEALEENHPITVPRDENGYAKGNTYILRPHHTLKKSYMLHDPIPRANKEAWQDIEKLHFTVRPHAFVGAKHNGQWYRLSDSGDTPIKVKENYKIDEEALNEISSLKKFKVYTPKYDTHVIVKAKNKDEAHREACSTSGSAYERPDVKITRVPEETLEEGLFDPAKQPLLALWDEHARRADAHGSGSRNEILKRIEDHVAKKHGQEGLKKMKLHTDLTNALNHSLSPDKGHLQAILGNMRSRCAMGV